MAEADADVGAVPLAGGVANAGRVVRMGDHVLRPASVHAPAIHALLRALRARGFDGAPEIVGDGVEPDGRERLRYIDGDVPIPPYPAWAQHDDALASIAVLLRRYHAAATLDGLPGEAGAWSDEMADEPVVPAAKATIGFDQLVVCHNDVCLENVVFRDGRAVALLDFEFAAPGRAVFDLSAFARMCVPVDDDAPAARLGWAPADRPARLAVVADAYGLDVAGRVALLRCLTASIERGGEFVRRRVERGEAAFIAMWDAMGGMERFDARRRWWAVAAARFEAALIR